MAQGSFGEIKAFEDFTGFPGGIVTVPDASGEFMGGWGLIGVNEGTIVATVDEPGGIVALTSDTGDDDNICLFAGTFKPSDGGMQMEVRFKIVDSVAATRAAVFVGFSETLVKDTPVMPAETATATTTYNGTGGMAGFLFDSDSTDLLWRFVAGDAAAALATINSLGDGGTVGGAIGINAAATVTADRWWIARIEIDEQGMARGYWGDADANKEMKFVGRNTAALGTGDSFHAVAMLENRSGANEILEVDYAYARGWRDWRPN